MPARPPRIVHPHHRVAAVLVVHDGARWLPENLAAIAAQTRPVQRLVAVDVASSDESPALLAAALGPDQVIRVGRSTPFADSVAAGLVQLDVLSESIPESPRPRRRTADDVPLQPSVDWLWLLHDDCAPDPTALAAMLDVAAADPSIAVLGPKARDWDDPLQLVEVGLSMDRAGRRETGLERREIDQGQHDDRRDVLAVGTAAMLVRHDVYLALGGFEPHLPLLREDMDLGWRARAAGHRVVVVPEARMRHARAAWTGRRPMAAAVGRPTGIDRRHSLMLLLAHLSTRSLAGALPRLLAGAVLRTVAFLLTRQLAAARDEVAAVAWSMRHVGDLRRMRAARRRTRCVPAADLRPFFVGRTARVRGYADAAADWLTGGANDPASSSAPDDPDADPADLPPSQGRTWRALRARPGAALVLLMAVAAALAARGLYGDGALVGGDLLPVPSGARALWSAYASSWHAVGAGTDTALSPAVAVVASAGTLLLGHARLAVTLVLLGAVPLAAGSAYVATRRLPVPRAIRVWAAASYAGLPLVTGGVARGRLDAVVAVVAIPLLVSGGHRLLTTDPRHAGWRLPFGYGLGLAAAMAFAPPVWTVAAIGLVVGTLAVLVGASPAGRHAARSRSFAVVFALSTPLIVLLPWSLRLVESPSLLMTGAATLNSGVVTVPTALDLLLLRAGGPAMLPPIWASAGLVLAAAAGLTHARRQLVAVAGWALALGGLTAALLVARGIADLAPASPVVPLAVAACGLLLSGAVAAEGALERLGRYDFGWRQPLAGGVAVAAVLTPVLFVSGWLVRGAADPLRRQDRVALPSVVLAEASRSPGSRVLWLDGSADGKVRYSLTATAGLTFADGSLPTGEGVSEVLNAVVADLVTPRGSNAAEALAAFNVRYIAVPNPAPVALANGLDAQAGLSRVSFVAPVQLWRTLTPTGRLTVIGPALAAAAVAGEVATRDQLRQTPPLPLPSRRESARAQLLPGPPGRLLVLSEQSDDEWVAELDGTRLAPTTAYGWAQAFELPAGAGVITLRRDNSARRGAIVVQALVLLVVVVLAAPPIRRRDDPITADDVGDEAEGGIGDQASSRMSGRAAEPVGASHVRRLQ